MREGVNEESQSNNGAVLRAKPAKQMKKIKLSGFMSMQRRRKMCSPKRETLYFSTRSERVSFISHKRYKTKEYEIRTGKKLISKPIVRKKC